MKTLVIIDMQPSFSAARDKKTIDGVIEEIKIAKNNSPVLVLEYVKHSPTDLRIKKELDSISNQVEFITKRNDDGSDDIICACDDLELPKNFRVCGVNIDACVWETVYGLMCCGHWVEVVKNACNTSSGALDPWHLYKDYAGDMLELV